MATKTKQTLTKEQRETLLKVADLIQNARFHLSHFGPTTLAQAGFIVGQAYTGLNQAEDIMDGFLDESNYND